MTHDPTDDPDQPEFSPDDRARLAPDEHGYDEDTEFVVASGDGLADNPCWTGDRYHYFVRPAGRRSTRSRREELNAYEKDMEPATESQ